MGDSQLSAPKTPAELRKVLLEGVTVNLNPAKERCERKFGAGNCVQLGDYSFVFKCNGRQNAVWADEKLKRFKCTLPAREGESEESQDSDLDNLGKGQEYEAVYYEILDG